MLGVVKITVNAAAEPVIASDRGNLMSPDASKHIRSDPGEFTFTLQHQYAFLGAFATIDGADDDSAKVSDIVEGIAENGENTIDIATIVGGAVADTAAEKTITLFIFGSKAKHFSR